MIGPFQSFEDALLWIARRFLFVREVGGQNRGIWVNMIQKLTQNDNGDSWCASWVSLVLGLAFGGKSPLPRTASCDVILATARKEGWLTSTPSVGDLFLLLKNPNDAHHVGIVTEVKNATVIGTIAGNTSEDGTSSNGDRVAEHDMTIVPGKIIFVAYPRPGLTLSKAA